MGYKRGCITTGMVPSWILGYLEALVRTTNFCP